MTAGGETPGPQGNESEETTRGWHIGDRVVYVPRYSFDAGYHRGVIVAIKFPDGPERPVFTVQAEPENGFGRVQLELAHLQSRW